MVADTYGVVLVSPSQLVEEEMRRNPTIARTLRANGGQLLMLDAIPDDILLRLIDVRLRQPDCRRNGWVLDGFPQT